MAQNLPIWMTDSSILEWADSIKLEVNLPRRRWPQFLQQALPEGLDDHYEGIIMPEVAVGGQQATGGALDVVPEWLLIFAEPLAQIDHISRRTPCVLQGMLEGHWIDRLSGDELPSWREASRGAAVVARGRGIETTLGVVEAGEDPIAAASVRATIPLANGEVRMMEVRGADLSALPVIEVVQAVGRWCRENEEGASVRAVHLGINGEMNAVAVAPENRRSSSNFPVLTKLIHRLIEDHAEEAANLVKQICQQICQKKLDRGHSVRTGAPVTLAVADWEGILVGEGALLVTEEEPAS